MNTVKTILVWLVTYGFPTIAIVVSILSFIDTRKANKVQNRLSDLEEKLKKYELEEKEKEREEANKACVDARVVHIVKYTYRMKFWNSGKATAYNVNFELPQEAKEFVWRQNVPYEFLDPGKNFEENIIFHSGTPTKFIIKTTWEDKEGNSYSKEQIVTL